MECPAESISYLLALLNGSFSCNKNDLHNDDINNIQGSVGGGNEPSARV